MNTLPDMLAVIDERRTADFISILVWIDGTTRYWEGSGNRHVARDAADWLRSIDPDDERSGWVVTVRTADETEQIFCLPRNSVGFSPLENTP